MIYGRGVPSNKKFKIAQMGGSPHANKKPFGKCLKSLIVNVTGNAVGSRIYGVSCITVVDSSDWTR